MKGKFWSVGAATFGRSEPQKWTDFFRASRVLCLSWPFVILNLNPDQIRICMPFRTYVIPKGDVELVKYQRSWTIWGIRIFHHNSDAPRYLVYQSFHNGGILKKFRGLGYPV
jgi:hypothetical protein